MRGYFYIIIAALLMWLPSFAERYDGHTGKVLVAYKMKHGSYFENAVVYIAAHSLMGATGFVQGVQLDAQSVSALKTIPDAIREAGLPIFKGGPVGLETTFFVLEHIAAPQMGGMQADKNSKKSKNKEKEDGVTPQLKVYDFMEAADEDRGAIVEKIIASYESDYPSPYVLYAGYAGWSPTQLELEAWRGAWLVLDGLDNVVSAGNFRPSETIWLDAFKRAVKNTEKKLGKIY
jgi:putative AlgH/UPF0301 family transcriptional regulator